MRRWTDFGEQRVLQDLLRRQPPADDMQLEDLRQLGPVGQKRVEIGFAEPAESFVGRRQQSQRRVTGEALHEVIRVIFYDAVEFVENSITLFLHGQSNKEDENTGS